MLAGFRLGVVLVLAFASLKRLDAANLIPGPSGLSVELKEWIQIPPSRPTSSTKARINHVKPEPGGPRLYCNDLRGPFWMIPGNTAIEPVLFMDLATIGDPSEPESPLFPNFVDSPGLGAGFTSFAFHPEFMETGSPGYGVFYTAHMESRNGQPDFAPPGGASASGQSGIITEWVMFDPTDSSLTASPANFVSREILRIEFDYVLHTFQEIAFNPNARPGDEDYGCLFICTGDGGAIARGKPQNTGRIDTVFGTILRIVPRLSNAHHPEDYDVSANGHYYIPTGPNISNPFVDAADPTPGDGFDVVEEIYAYGFRNPHRISWDTGGTGKMFCGTIGETSIEEIEVIRKGHHYGWPFREGSFVIDAYNPATVTDLPEPDVGPTNSPPEPVAFTYPAAMYSHDIPRIVGSSGIAISGGTVYRGSRIPYLRGKYLCGDLVQGWIFAVDERNLRVQTPQFSGDAPAELQYLDVLSNGAVTTVGSIVSGSRADLRFGTDADGELLVISKTSAKIYTVLPAGASSIDYGRAEDWQGLQSFDDVAVADLVLLNEGDDVNTMLDPGQDPINRVVELDAAADPVSARIAIPPVAEGKTGTLFFRLRTEAQDAAFSIGLTDLADPFLELESPENLPELLEIELFKDSSKPELLLRDGGILELGRPLEADTWYSIWLVANNSLGEASDSVALYVQGGPYAEPTLASYPAAFRNGTTESLKNFIFHLSAGSSPVYFDDLFVDPEHLNLTDPTADRWRLVDNFQQGSLADDWALADANVQVTDVVTASDNQFVLSHAAASPGTENLTAFAMKQLPTELVVGTRSTVYFRFMVESFPARHSLGVSPRGLEAINGFDVNDLETTIVMTGDGGSGELAFYNGAPGVEALVPSLEPVAILPGKWYEGWLVINNGGYASGGQRYEFHIRDADTMRTPTRLASDLHFRSTPELPLVTFAIVSGTGSDEIKATGTLFIDDLYQFNEPLVSGPFDPRIQNLSFDEDNGQLELIWRSVGLKQYQFQESEDFSDWSFVGEPFEGDATWKTTVFETGGSRRFYRLILEPAEIGQ